MRITKCLCQGRDQRVGRRLRLADQLAKQLAADELGARGLLEQNARNVIAVPFSAAVENRLRLVVVLARHLLKLVADHEPSGEGPRGLPDILLAVLAPAQRE